MSSLYLPPGVTHAMLAERQQREARMLEVIYQSEVCKEFDPDLKRIDPALSMVFCPEPAPLDAVAAGARPGRFNIMREAPGGPRSFMPIVGPDGEFVDPTSRVFEQLKAQDWWDPRVRRERRELERKMEDTRQRVREEERRHLNEEVYERYVAGTRTQVSLNRDTPWAQNAAGYKKVRGEKKAP